MEKQYTSTVELCLSKLKKNLLQSQCGDTKEGAIVSDRE
jgi:hypothetical protein